MIERARNVTVKLHGRIGKYVKLQLWFAAKWIMLSEISFDSGKKIFQTSNLSCNS
jgi:discoidin domain receptor family member 2